MTTLTHGTLDVPDVIYKHIRACTSNIALHWSQSINQLINQSITLHFVSLGLIRGVYIIVWPCDYTHGLN